MTPLFRVPLSMACSFLAAVVAVGAVSPAAILIETSSNGAGMSPGVPGSRDFQPFRQRESPGRIAVGVSGGLTADYPVSGCFSTGQVHQKMATQLLTAAAYGSLVYSGTAEIANSGGVALCSEAGIAGASGNLAAVARAVIRDEITVESASIPAGSGVVLRVEFTCRNASVDSRDSVVRIVDVAPPGGGDPVPTATLVSSAHHDPYAPLGTLSLYWYRADGGFVGGTTRSLGGSGVHSLDLPVEVGGKLFLSFEASPEVSARAVANTHETSVSVQGRFHWGIRALDDRVGISSASGHHYGAAPSGFAVEPISEPPDQLLLMNPDALRLQQSDILGTSPVWRDLGTNPIVAIMATNQAAFFRLSP